MSGNSSHSNGKQTIIAGAFIALAALVALCIFIWDYCRVYVPAGQMAIVTAKSGKEPEPGKILVERGEKGIWAEVLTEGRHFLNPITHDVRIMDATVIPLGKIGIVISKVGRELAPGEIIAPDKESKGVWRDVLGPGVYRFNPEGYSVEIADAINIPAGYVGVVTSQSGTLPQPGQFAKIGEKGVLQDILQPGLYYINHYAYQVNVIEIGMNQVSMTSSDKGESVFNTKSRLNTTNEALQELEANTLNFQQELRKQNQTPNSSVKLAFKKALASKSKPKKMSVMEADMEMAPVNCAQEKLYENDKMQVDGSSASNQNAEIFGVSKEVEFPSRDGFKVSLEMTVEFELKPKLIATIYQLYGDLPQVVEKIILPQVLSVSRLKGSSYSARDFIMGEGRENFQKDLQEELSKALDDKNIIVHNAIIRTVEIPMNILSPIRAVSLAHEQDLTNIAMQETAKKLGELNTETELIEQRRREVIQETEKLVATTAAECRQEVDTITAENSLDVAEIDLKRSKLLAQTSQLKGATEVQVKFLVQNESALGEGMLAKALGGGDALAKLKAVQALNSKVETRVIYAGEGTLWTDLKNAAIPVK